MVRAPRSQPPAYGSLKLAVGVQQRTEEHDHRCGSAAPPRDPSSSRSKVRAGRTSSRSLPSSDQVARTPMLISTSRIRLTSSILAMPRMTVRPRFSRLAHSSATAAFFDDRTSILPLSLAPPWTRRCCGSADAHRDQWRVERLRDPVDHLQTEVLVAGLDPMHSALTGPEDVRELGLGQATMLARVTDEAADPVQVGFSHCRSPRHDNSYVRYLWTTHRIDGQLCGLAHLRYSLGDGPRP